jgi:hypothetical protein
VPAVRPTIPSPEVIRYIHDTVVGVSGTGSLTAQVKQTGVRVRLALNLRTECRIGHR